MKLRKISETPPPPGEEYKLTAENMMRQLPGVLKIIEKLNAISEGTAEELAKDADNAEIPRLFSRLDELPEKVLDALAFDFKVDWYDYNYSKATKVELIKSAVMIHRHMGTPGGVEQMIRDIAPGSHIEEWFQYGGEPHHFRIELVTENQIENIDTAEVLSAVEKVKRLSSWLDSLNKTLLPETLPTNVGGLYAIGGTISIPAMG